MTISIHGISVSKGITIGRAVLVASSRMDVAHYFIEPDQVDAEIDRARKGRNAVIDEISRLQLTVSKLGPKDAPQELRAMLDVHLMLLQDHEVTEGVKSWIRDRLYNAEWALTSQLEAIARQFDEMEDAYLRERKSDLEQITEKVLRAMKGLPATALAQAQDVQHVGEGKIHRGISNHKSGYRVAEILLSDADAPLVLVAHELSPADMLQFKQSVFTGFVTDVGGKTSHTAIVARSMDIPAVVGTRTASTIVKQDDWIIIDGEAGVVILDPSPNILAEYNYKQKQLELERSRLSRLLTTPSVTLDGQRVELLANIEMPTDSAQALEAGAQGVGLFRSEFLFMGRPINELPSEEEQYLAYRMAVEGMQGLPVTIRTIDVGADKPMGGAHAVAGHLNPALGLRAIRWSLSDPDMFVSQLRAIYRAAAHGPVRMMIPMLAHLSEIRQTIDLVTQARDALQAEGVATGAIEIGAMIEIPAAVLIVQTFLKHFDFLSIGTNDLIQYTLAIDRTDESVAHLYDPMHPAVLRLIADTIGAARAAGKPVSVCGEMAGDLTMTRLLLGLGLRCFSMHPAQILAVKQEVVRNDTSKLNIWAQQVLASDEPAQLLMH
jgi:phosphotransferase system enzyme I (PtsI)